MSQPRHGVNAFRVGEVELLLTVAGSGNAVHLARSADPRNAGRSAVHEFYFRTSNRRSVVLERAYDRAELLAPRWARVTLCGRKRAVMVAGDGGPFDRLNDEAAFIPRCR